VSQGLQAAAWGLGYGLLPACCGAGGMWLLPGGTRRTASNSTFFAVVLTSPWVVLTSRLLAAHLVSSAAGTVGVLLT
jgi:hypothetical protein